MRLHGTGSDTTYGCISIPDENVRDFVEELDKVKTTTVMVRVKRAFFKKVKEEEQIRYGTLQIIDKTIKDKTLQEE